MDIDVGSKERSLHRTLKQLPDCSSDLPMLICFSEAFTLEVNLVGLKLIQMWIWDTRTTVTKLLFQMAP